MDVLWFKKKQKEAGVTAGQIAERMGRARSSVSHIYSGQQRMSLDWAKVFAEMLQVPLNEVLQRAGEMPEGFAEQVVPGFAEGDAAPFFGTPSERRKVTEIASFFGGNVSGIDVWTVAGYAMALDGLLPGDQVLVDTFQADRARPGDVVVAQHYDAGRAAAVTLLRRFEPPVLVAASVDPEHKRAIYVDGRVVAIRGVVIAQWRQNFRTDPA